MTTTLTKEALLDKCKARYEEVEVEGFGTVGIRSVSPVKQSLRTSSYFDDDGKFSEAEGAKRDIYKLIDQVMIDENTPMFTDADFSALDALDSAKLDPLFAAINIFNGVQKKEDPSAPSSDTSSETTD